MAYRIFWTPIAVQDLRDICDFISRDNPVAAQRMGEELIKQSEAMAVFPQSVWMPLPAPGTLREDLVLSAGELPGSRVLPMDVVARFPAVISTNYRKSLQDSCKSIRSLDRIRVSVIGRSPPKHR